MQFAHEQILQADGSDRNELRSELMKLEYEKNTIKFWHCTEEELLDAIVRFHWTKPIKIDTNDLFWAMFVPPLLWGAGDIYYFVLRQIEENI